MMRKASLAHLVLNYISWRMLNGWGQSYLISISNDGIIPFKIYKVDITGLVLQYQTVI
jgi:hypothetical protein